MSHEESSPPTNLDGYDPDAVTARSDDQDGFRLASPMPELIGRYRVQRKLGSGGFGAVYLARDQQLDRLVAVKVPHARLMRKPADAEPYLAEARLVAGLDHPHIVPVYDVGASNEFSLYIVSKYIEGETFAQRMSSGLDPVEAASILAPIADALHYAHTKGIVHRDVKPGNLLIDHQGIPFVVDFGLALKDSEIGRGPRYIGTPAYMSPEQARGEGHRVDGRSDVHAVGVVLYEMLTGRRAFSAGSRSELLEQVATREIRPPRQLDDTIPRELERICLKATAKRATDRYTTARDLADDLRYFCAVPLSSLSGGSVRSDTALSGDDRVVTGDDTARHQLDTSRGDSVSLAMQVIPKGLRSFNEQDAEFFLMLLPGPRDRWGLPEGIRFWKAAVERRDVDRTFRVGLIYGPSGCGKSSLVKAGLFPQLDPMVVPIYVEATAHDTEARILRQLQKKGLQVEPDTKLSEALAALRRNAAHDERKWLLVIDQFEQWLHAHADRSDAELIRALRQCDGSNVQSILMVRDDFWMAITRFMRALEVPLLEGVNSAPVDLFPVRHAERVLTAFGRALDALPPDPTPLDRDQEAFVQRSIAGLAVDGKVICVRLALFAEMMKDKPWSPATLRAHGGTEGVGITFLEETFHGPTAPPDHRMHELAARNVLQALLPATASDIRGQMKSYSELLEVSGYAARPAEFDDLLRLLDSEIRLITPTDPEAARSDSVTKGQAEVGGPVESGEVYYQLTHDYLVPSLRGWLTRRQRETFRGRAALRLNERAALWKWKSENRHLPSLPEYLTISLFTSPSQWDVTERRMMKRASSFYGRRTATWSLLLVLLIVGGVIAKKRWAVFRKDRETRAVVEQLLVADVAMLPELVASIDDRPVRYQPLLGEIASDSNRTPAERLRANYALANRPGEPADRLIALALKADMPSLAAICSRIEPYADEVDEQIWKQSIDSPSSPSRDLRAAALLAVADPKSQKWEDFAARIVTALTRDKRIELDPWTVLLEPVSDWLMPPLKSLLTDRAAREIERVRAASMLAEYANGYEFAELLMVAEPGPYAELFPASAQHRPIVVEASLRALQSDFPQSDRDSSLDHARELRNAIITLLRMGRPEEVEPYLSSIPDPTARTMVMLQMRDFGVTSATLLEALDSWNDPIARQAVLLSLSPYLTGKANPSEAVGLLDELVSRMSQSPHQAERSAVLWLLRSNPSADATETKVAAMTDRSEETSRPDERRDWFVTAAGQTMVKIYPSPTELSEEFSQHFKDDSAEDISDTLVPFAMSANAITREDYRQLFRDARFALDVAPEDACPANKVGFIEAMKYCRLLSERDNVPLDQMCYPPVDEIKAEHADLTPERRALTGYRLPTELEWEFGYCGGAVTDWHCGQTREHLPAFAWFAVNSSGVMHPVGLLRPNQYGLFDMAGNVSEWCHSYSEQHDYILRGGNYKDTAQDVTAGSRVDQSMTGYSFTGFRIVRTLDNAE